MEANLRLLRWIVFLSILNRCLTWNIDEFELFDLVEEINDNFYNILGISQDASSSDIRKAYRKLSLQLHPDKNKAEDAAEKFRQLVGIYEVLKDEEKRKRYDQILVEGLPDWRTPVFYYRRARKMGFLELSALLAIIITIGQYLVGWAVYFERRLTLEDMMDSKKKKEKKKRKKETEEDKLDELQEEIESLPRPRLLDLWPFRLTIFLCGCVQGAPQILMEFKEEWAKKQRMRAEEKAAAKEEEEEEEEVETVIRKPKRQKVVVPEYSSELYETAVPFSSMGLLDPACDGEFQQPTPRTKGVEWSEEEMVLLSKAVNKFPGGTANRWEKIANMVGRSMEEVSAKSKEVKGTYVMNLSSSVQGDVLTNKVTKKGSYICDDIISTAENDFAIHSLSSNSADSESTARRRHRPTKIHKTADRTLMISTTPLPKDSSKPSSVSETLTADTKLENEPVKNEVLKPVEQWTQNQQMIFEWALRQFPKGTDKRWDKIAEHIPGKTKEDCIARFKYLAEVVKKKKDQQDN